MDSDYWLLITSSNQPPSKSFFKEIRIYTDGFILVKRYFSEMYLPSYPLKAEKSFMVFEFISVGRKGRISKLIKFSKTNLYGVYNLSFGDKEVDKEDIDDAITSNNGDQLMVLATVVAAVYVFTSRYSGAWIYATGSTPARTRLYRIGIAKYILEIEKDFDLFAMKDEGWCVFRKNEAYEAFLVKRKP